MLTCYITRLFPTFSVCLDFGEDVSSVFVRRAEPREYSAVFHENCENGYETSRGGVGPDDVHWKCAITSGFRLVMLVKRFVKLTNSLCDQIKPRKNVGFDKYLKVNFLEVGYECHNLICV